MIVETKKEIYLDFYVIFEDLVHLTKLAIVS